MLEACGRSHSSAPGTIDVRCERDLSFRYARVGRCGSNPQSPVFGAGPHARFLHTLVGARRDGGDKSPSVLGRLPEIGDTATPIVHLRLVRFTRSSSATRFLPPPPDVRGEQMATVERGAELGENGKRGRAGGNERTSRAGQDELQSFASHPTDHAHSLALCRQRPFQACGGRSRACPRSFAGLIRRATDLRSVTSAHAEP